MDGVDEVYGFHNTPSKPLGYCVIKPGITAAEASFISIELIGKGGHGSLPQLCLDPIQAGIDFHVALKELIKKQFEGKHKFNYSLPVFHAGVMDNIIPDTAVLQGRLGTYDEKLTQEMRAAIRQLLEKFKEEKRVLDYTFTILGEFPMLINTEKEAAFVHRVAE